MDRRKFVAQAVVATASAASVGRAAPVAARIRIGQIGTKHAHAPGKIAAIRKLSRDFEFIGVVEPDLEQRRRMQSLEAYRDVVWMSEDELLSSDGLRAVAIETDVPNLVPTALRAVEAGMHIHLDKPGGPSLEDFQRLTRRAAEQQLVVQMGYMLRYNPAFEFMVRAVRDGWLGSIMEIDASMGKLASAKGRQEMAWHPGGGMFELGGHLIDSIVHMLGKPQRVVPITRRTQADGLADNQLAVLVYEEAIATVRCNHLDPYGFPRRRFHISGDKGSIEIAPLESGQLTLMLDEPRGEYSKGVHAISLKPTGGRYDGEFIDLAKVLRGESRFGWSPEHDIATHSTLLLACADNRF